MNEEKEELNQHFDNLEQEVKPINSIPQINKKLNKETKFQFKQIMSINKPQYNSQTPVQKLSKYHPPIFFL